MAVTQGINDDGTLVERESYYNSTSSKTNNNGTLDKDSFLQLLVAEMQYQDPLEPQSNTEFVAQFASFSQVEALQNMQLTYQQSLGTQLIGKPVIMRTESSSGESGYVCGRVEYTVSEGSKVYVSIEDSLYDIDDLDTVMDEDYYTNVVLKKQEESSSDTDDTANDSSEDDTTGLDDKID